MQTLHTLPFVAIAILALVAVLCPYFDDNFVQRVGLSITGVGAAIVAWVLTRGCPASENAMVMLAYGVLTYGAGTALKVRYFRRLTWKWTTQR